MDKNIRTTILLSLLLNTSASYAQEAINPEMDTIKWHYGDIRNELRSENINISGHFISYSNKGFLWVQDGIDRTYKFDVKSVEGTWTDAGEKGELIYWASCGGEQGSIRLSRVRGELKIELDFVQPDKYTPHLVLTVDSYIKL
jgi:hypothetical protein